MVSYHDYFRKLHGYRGDLDDFLKKFMNGWFRYGTWKSNVSSWVAHVDNPNMLLVRFEDLRADPVATVRKIADFADLTCDDQRIKDALESSSVDKVHATMRSWVVARRTDFKGGVSSGGQKNWRQTLTAEQNARFVESAGDLLERLSYPLV